jgi:hypothetical protein
VADQQPGQPADPPTPPGSGTPTPGPAPPDRPDRPEPALPRVVTVAGQLAAAAGGLTAVVVVAGGLVLTFRLVYDAYPFWAGAVQLPNGVLLAVGVSQVVLPALLVGVLYWIARYPFDSHSPRVGRGGTGPWAVSTAGFFLLLAVPSAVVVWWRLQVTRVGQPDLLGAPGGAVTVVLVVALLVTAGVVAGIRERELTKLRQLTGETDQQQTARALAWRRLDRRAAMTATYTGAAAVAFVAAGSLVAFSPVTVCPQSGRPVTGQLVAQTETGVLVGTPPTIRVVPSTRVALLVIGDGATSASCPPADPPPDSSP